jgi:hypothetical protein
MAKIDIDNVHILRNKKHKDCDWYDFNEFECTNWRELIDPECNAFVECYAPIGSIFKDKKGVVE